MAKILSQERVLEYSKEFKVKIVQLSEQQGIQVTQIAKGMGLHPVMIYRWRQEYREGKLSAEPIRRVSMTLERSPPNPPSGKQRSDNDRLRQENERLKRENMLLKKWHRYLAEVRQNDSDTSTDTDQS